MGTRDDMCGIDVGRMAELGGFAEEITIYGCAYKENGEVLYRVTDDADEAYRFYDGAARKGLLPTLPHVYVRREIIPAGQRERMTDEAKRTCARQMQAAFDASFWTLLDALAACAPTNGAYEMLERHRQALEGRYAREPLALFSVFLDEALRRHRLTREAYEQFAAWVQENEEKMADDWIVKERNERTFYGFASGDSADALRLQVDTAPYNLLEKQQALRLQGKNVTPMFCQTMQYRESAELPKVRRQFQEWLKDTAVQVALPFETALTSGDTPKAPFAAADYETLSEAARRTLDYYLHLWGLA